MIEIPHSVSLVSREMIIQTIAEPLSDGILAGNNFGRGGGFAWNK